MTADNLQAILTHNNYQTTIDFSYQPMIEDHNRPLPKRIIDYKQCDHKYR